MKYPNLIHCLWIKRYVKIMLTCLIMTGFAWGEGNASILAFEEGKQYQRIEASVLKNPLVQGLMNEANGKVQVIEFFSYACDWCHKLDPKMEEWLLKQPPNAISFQRIPVEFQPSWRPLTKAYYTALNLGVLNKIHEPLFEAIQTDQLKEASEGALRKFFVQKGVQKASFNQMFNSAEINAKLQWANAMTRAYQVASVPAILVQGPKGSFISNVRMSESEENLFKVVDYLINLENQPKKEQ